MRPTVIALALAFSAVSASVSSAQTHRDEAVTFRNGSVTIAGTLSLPAGAGPFPAVVLLSGSRPQDRDSDMLGFKPFKLISAFATHVSVASTGIEKLNVLVLPNELTSVLLNSPEILRRGSAR